MKEKKKVLFFEAKWSNSSYKKEYRISFILCWNKIQFNNRYICRSNANHRRKEQRYTNGQAYSLNIAEIKIVNLMEDVPTIAGSREGSGNCNLGSFRLVYQCNHWIKFPSYPTIGVFLSHFLFFLF